MCGPNNRGHHTLAGAVSITFVGLCSGNNSNSDGLRNLTRPSHEHLHSDDYMSLDLVHHVPLNIRESAFPGYSFFEDNERRVA